MPDHKKPKRYSGEEVKKAFQRAEAIAVRAILADPVKPATLYEDQEPRMGTIQIVASYYSPMVVPVIICTASGDEKELELPFQDGGEVIVPEDCHIIRILPARRR